VRRQLRKVKLFGMHRLLRLGSFSSDVVLGDASAQESVVSKYVERVLEEHRAEADGALRIEWDAELVKVLAALPSQSQSCVICVGFGALDAAAAVAEVHRVLRPRAIFLGVLPGVVMPFDVAAVNDYWRFTAEGARRLFAKHFGADVEAAHLGNSVTALAALHRLRADSLEESEFTPTDSQHQLLVRVRAVRH
jgi:hypothetical protein